MYQYKGVEDTIAAISTATAPAGIGVVRLSGRSALAIAEKMFSAKSGRRPSQCAPYTVHYGHALRSCADDPGRMEILDEVLLTVMRAPRSYTREDVVEISCHGGIVSLKTVLKTALSLGARLAEPGEFTKRAFLNGRIDLTQAEAVLDIIQAKTDSFLKISTNQLKGELAAELEAIRDQLMNTFTHVEAAVNFPEDDVEAQSREQITALLRAAHSRVEKLLASSEQGRILREGIKIVICGRPNAGKSSLLNLLLRQPRAIVSEIEGTTRDTIEETAQIDGIPFHLVDTAGILEPRDLIEQEAVRRSRMSIQSADLVLLMLDGGKGISCEDKELMAMVQDSRAIAVINKCDLPMRVSDEEVRVLLPDKTILRISALTRQGIERLQEGIVNEVLHGHRINPDGILVSNLRHIEALQNARTSLQSAGKVIEQGLALEFVSEEIKRAVNALDGITGRNIDGDLLDQIFSAFCIGK